MRNNILSTFQILQLLLLTSNLTRYSCEAEERKTSEIGNTVAVIGAGMSGLTAAWYLEEKGYNVTVFEKNNRVGGSVHSVVIGNESLTVNDYNDAEKCEWNGGYASELGAVCPTIPLGSDMLDIADELGASYTTMKSDRHVILKNKRKIEVDWYPYSVAIRKPLRFLLEYALLQRVIKQYPEIQSTEYSNYSSDLYIPMMEFAKKKGFPNIAKIVREYFVAFGYAYFEDVPAAYFIRMFNSAERDTGRRCIVFKCGFQSFLESIANTITRVELGVEITEINRFQNGTVEVIGTDDTNEHFDHIVIASGLQNLPFIMDVSEEENDLFTRVNTIKYITSYVKGSFTEDACIPSKPMDMIALEGNSVIDRIDNVNLLFVSPSGAAVVWQIVDDNTTLEEAAIILKQNLRDSLHLENIIIQRQELWPNYFPTVNTEAFMDGYHGRVEALQGSHNTYYLDPSLSFHSTRMVFEFARDLVESKFDDVN